MSVMHAPKSDWPTMWKGPERASSQIPASTRQEAPAPVERQWRESAACATAADPDMWFPDPRSVDDESAAKAKRICRGCPVIEDCRRFAEATDPAGIWAAESEWDRRLRLAGGGMAAARNIRRRKADAARCTVSPTVACPCSGTCPTARSATRATPW